MMKQNATKADITANLTRSERALLEVLLNPENRMKSVANICKIAKIDRSTYYRAFQKPDFVEIYKQQAIDLVKQSVAPIINTFIREAQRGSFQHGKILLEMAGVYSENLKLSADVNVNNPYEGLTTEELKKLINDG
jgi:hypothetical protein